MAGWLKEASGGGSGDSHPNLSTLNKLGESGNELTFNGSPISGGVASISSDVATRLPIVVFLLDDASAVHYNNLNIWTSRGVAYTTGLRMDWVDGATFTYEMLRTMQAAGVEIAYHGKSHDGVGSGSVTLASDVEAFLSTASAEGLKIEGYIGPSGTYDERIVFHDHFHTFKWARGAGATNGVANVRDPVDFFKLIKGSFIDDLSTTAALDTLKLKIDALATRGTGVLTLSMHMTAGQVTYVDQLLSYIQSKGIQIMTARDAYEIYGAVIELYDNSLQLGDDFSDRVDGNGGITVNVASPHFVLMKDGTLFSNAAAMKMITPKFKNVALNGNTLPDFFPVGVSIVQYGSTDDRTGFPNVGTLYHFNLGKNLGQQFQLFKASGKGGVYFREANTDNTWKTPMADNKLGIFRAAKPTTPTSAGFPGDYSADANYLYVCYAENTWVRVPKDNTWV